jgi:hypothetical protein
MRSNPYSPTITDDDKNDAVNVQAAAARLYQDGREDEARALMRTWHGDRHPALIREAAERAARASINVEVPEHMKP